MTRLRIFVVTGQSGAGKSTALRVLEDLGYYCVDNLPSSLAKQLVDVAQDAGADRLAYGVDIRLLRSTSTADPIAEAGAAIDQLRQAGHDVRVLFCSASDEALVRRFSETRRPHPLGSDVLDAIRREPELLAPLRARSNLVVDTTGLSVHDLRRRLVDFVHSDGSAAAMTTRIVSFGFKYGIPVDADLVFDVRFMPNPHFVPELKPRTGQDPEVARFVLDTPEAAELFQHLVPMLSLLIPRYQSEGKSSLTVAIGCTGGRHRSVAVSEELARRLPETDGRIVVSHRDTARG